MENKTILRKALAAQRREAFESNSQVGEKLAEVFLCDGPEIPSDRVLAAYWPIRTEIDTRPLMVRLLTAGVQLALPFAPDRLGHLNFKRYDGGPPLGRDAWDIPAPAANAPILRPNIVLAPVLGFDAAGGRIGYGAGLFDRALNRLRASGPVLAVGLAFACQEVEEIPREPHDAVLDWVVTEEGVKVRP